MTAMPRVVILGASGHIGRSIEKALVREGAEVIGHSSKTLDLTRPDALSILDAVVDPDTVLVFAAALTPDRGQNIGALMTNLAMAANVGRYLETHAGGSFAIANHLAEFCERVDLVTYLGAVNPLRAIHRAVIAQTSDPVIAIWGLAYKENTASIANSPVLSLIEALGGFTLRAYDRAVRLAPGRFKTLSLYDQAFEACRGADALAIMTPWPELRTLDVGAIADAMRGRVVIDPYSMLAAESSIRHRLTCLRLGAPANELVAQAC